MFFLNTSKADLKQPKYQRTSKFQTFRFLIVNVSVTILFSASISYCQTLTVGVGLIKYQDVSNQPVYSLYPEVQLSNHFIDKQTVNFGGSIYWGYWNDGVADLASCADCFTYSYNSHIIGARFEMKLKEFPVPISIFSGISRHFIKANYIGGQDFAGNRGQDFAEGTNAVEVGIWTHIPLHGRLSMRGNF